MRLVVAKSPSEALALTNCVIVNPNDLEKLGKSNYAVIKQQYLVTLRPENSILTGHAGFSSTHRNWMQLALNDEIEFEGFDPFKSGGSFLQSARFEVDVLRKHHQTALTFDTDRMEEVFLSNFGNQVLTVGQPLVMDFGGHNLLLKVHSLIKLPKVGAGEPQLESTTQWGVMTGKTECQFSKSADSLLKLVGSHQINTNAIIQPDFKFEDMGIGGLDAEFWMIFRRAFTSRLYPQDLANALGIKHIKGLILYGPPGTGKTLMARQIAKMLHAREPKIVNGPEILNKYVGQSEENIRNLFKDAELEYKSKGENSQLHIIIFDELDAICKQRGGRNDGTGVGDSVVNQLLAKMDGVEQLNNILVIGMTNRLDMLDAALMRPGRFEVQLEIGLPDKSGRAQILKIHTKSMRENNKLGSDVDIDELAGLCKNFTGAEIVGLINSATSFALSRHIKVGNTVEVAKDANMVQVKRDDFIRALGEVHAAYGVDEDEFSSLGQDGVVIYSDEMKLILDQAHSMFKQAENTERNMLAGILLHGAIGSGVTAIGAKLATECQFPFAKLLSSTSLVGLSEHEKINFITKIFSDAYKSKLSVVMVDDLEQIIEYVGIGPRFSTGILMALSTFFHRPPPEGRRLIVIATTHNVRLMEQLGISKYFRTQLHIPNVTTIEDFRALLERNQNLLAEHQKLILEGVERLIARGHLFSIPIKSLQNLLEVVALDEVSPVQKFTDEFEQYILRPMSNSSNNNIISISNE